MADKSENSPENPEKALTCIHDTYTLNATPKEGELSKPGEIDNMMIKDFLETLAEVALAVAVRTAMRDHKQEDRR